MFITELRLTNWGPFRGEHRLPLGPGIYAVVARHHSDPHRSNWSGKTWMLSAIRYVLYGLLPETCPKEDDWITWGEDAGALGLTFDNGISIDRARTRGKSTRIVAKVPGRDDATQKAAQGVIIERLVMDAGDYKASLWVGQKQISELVTMRSTDRQNLVNSWLGLDPLRLSEQNALAELRRVSKESAALRAQCMAPTEGDPIDLEPLIVAVEEAESRLDALRMEAVEWEAHNKRLQEKADYDRLVERGTALKNRIEGADPPSLQYHENLERETSEALAAASEAAAVHRATTAGLDDGLCPASLEPCPVADRVNTRCAERGEELVSALALVDRARADHDEAYRAYHDACQEHDDLADDVEQLEAMRKELDEFDETLDYFERRADAGIGDPREITMYDIRAASDDLIEARGQLHAAELHNAGVEKAAQRVQEAHDAAEAADERAREWAAAARLLRGARREVAESALGSIQDETNTTLADAGIDLEMSLRWEREGDKLTPVCFECGASISGQRDKVCPECGANRGQQLIEDFAVVMSDRSGAADDIVGLALQLSAAVWLRDARGSELGVVCIDEPFGALDGTNRIALARHLQQMVGSKFEQAFVVAHDAAIMEALPKRIVVEVTDGGSVPRVEQ